MKPDTTGLDWATFPERRRHELLLTVQPADLDDLHHVNNVTYLAWCEAVARAHVARLGLDTPALVALGAVPVAREHTVTYLRPALLGDTVRVRTFLTGHAGFRSVRQYVIDRVSPGPEARLVECRTDWVWVDPVSGRPKRTPPEVGTGFGLTRA